MEQWNRQIKTARYLLLGTVIVTVLDAVFLLGNLELFISYCAAVPYYLLWLGKLFDNGYFMGPVNGEFAATGLCMAGVVLAVYLLVWWLARDSRKWLQIGFWMLVVDLAVLIVLALVLFAEPLSCFWEVVLHLAVLWEMGQGLKAWKARDAALGKGPEEAVPWQEEAEPQREEDPVL